MEEILKATKLTEHQTTIVTLLWPRRGSAGRWTSGAEIAEALGNHHTQSVTVARLQRRLWEAGWTIETSRRGYRMRKVLA